MSTAGSVHIGAQGVGQGEVATLDLSLTRGSGATGTTDVFGGSLDLIRIRNKVYMRGDRSFWRHFGRNQRKLALLAGRWVEAPSSVPAFKGIASFTDISGVSALLRSRSHWKLVNDGVRTFRGRQVIALRDATEGGSLYVRASGTPYPVAMVGGAKGGQRETIVFDRWNQRVVVRAPKNALSLGAGA